MKSERLPRYEVIDCQNGQCRCVEPDMKGKALTVRTAVVDSSGRKIFKADELVTKSIEKTRRLESQMGKKLGEELKA